MFSALRRPIARVALGAFTSALALEQTRSSRTVGTSSLCSHQKPAPGQIDVVLGAQWGDEGKGKLVDILAFDYDICARVAGGSNAGHTIVADGKKYKVRTCSVPSTHSPTTTTTTTTNANANATTTTTTTTTTTHMFTHTYALVSCFFSSTWCHRAYLTKRRTA